MPPNGEKMTTWLSSEKAAKRMGVTTRTLYRFINEGQVPAYKFGRVIRLKADEIDEFIQSCRLKPGDITHLTPERYANNGDEE